MNERMTDEELDEIVEEIYQAIMEKEEKEMRNSGEL